MRWTSASLALALAASGCALSVLLALIGSGGVQATVVPPWEFAATAAAYFVTGAIAWRRRPENRAGRLMMGVGAGLLVVMARGVPLAPVAVLSRGLLGINEVIIAYLLLAFPAGRLGPGPERSGARAIIVAYVFLAAIQIVTLDTTNDPYCRGCPPNPFRLISVAGLGGEVTALALLASGVLGALVFVLLAHRWRIATPAARRAMAPIIVAGALETFGVATRFVAAPDPAAAFLISRTAFLFELTVPVAILIGFLRARLDRSSVADLVVALGRDTSPEQIEVSLRATLRDPTLTVASWSGASRAYLDRDGRPITLPGTGSGRAVTPLDHDGRPLAAIVHDEALLDEPELITAAAAALGLAVTRDHLRSSIRAQVAEARRLPRGVVTLLFADIEGSTGLAERLGGRWPETLLEVRRLVAGIVRHEGGVEVDARADEFFAAFPEAADAVAAALAIQRGLSSRGWPDGEGVRMRIGLHTGEPELSDEGYVGAEIHRAARVANAGHGGQVLLTDATREAAGDAWPADAAVLDLGAFHLRGLQRAERIYQLVAPGLGLDFPALRTEAG
ncbi:MAG: adenylate/guanylate cyclase domain-containing protein [Candidatus Limnocylindrales bacterium]